MFFLCFEWKYALLYVAGWPNRVVLSVVYQL